LNSKAGCGESEMRGVAGIEFFRKMKENLARISKNSTVFRRFSGDFQVF